MQGEWISLTMSDGHAMPCYHVVPEGERRGGLVLVQEIFGVTEHIREMCEEYAADGYEVISRSCSTGSSRAAIWAIRARTGKGAVQIARGEHDWDQGIDDTARCIAWLKEKGGPVFIAGYCFGGSVSWRMAQLSDDLDAASCYYGGYVATRFADQAPKCATITHFGRFDSMVPIEPVEKLIEKQHPTAQHFIYEAGHGFNSDRRKDYHPESAELAKERTLMLFRALGG